ncbi:RidA family protein [Arthrobacter sp. CDRTa11]|uniref:RidA family protein n=1 Tax=Arthrobacter sp. CDRTa11 TaxID=2651199 RepID=UPI002265F87E|nr:RidA family protein [Arthrobacter sp. CDRTa11]UZX02867.1 RidA family protein [Arthrobacter sp. CDRTa11]
MKRKAIDVPGLGHGGAPIPQACVVGGLLMSGGISGMDPATGQIPEELPEQITHLFSNVHLVLKQAGGTPDDIIKMTFFVRDRSVRPLLDTHWVQMFPDAQTRPARHLLIVELPGALAIQCEIFANLEGSL